MRFTTPMGFEHTKAAHVAAFLLLRAGVPVTKLKLIKLVYIAEREFLRQYGRSMTLDTFCSLPHGPVNVFIGRPNDSVGITQLSAPFSPTAVTKDGAPIGDLQSVEVDENGYLQAIYNTGFRRTLYQIPVGDVPNMNGLKALDSQAYQVSAESGNLYLWDASAGPVGSVAGYSLMESTTDIAAELTDLIETQRAYTSNAKIVQTVDEMLQETTNLKR